MGGRPGGGVVVGGELGASVREIHNRKTVPRSLSTKHVSHLDTHLKNLMGMSKYKTPR